MKYAYTTGTLGAAVQTIPYVYGDSNWKDKLTSYNGKAITYDAIGNPLTDGTWTYTWQAGRQLKQMTKSGMTVLFKYDHNGLRVGKVVNGTETRYVLHGKLVTHMSCGSDNLHFFYDAQSRPAKVDFNGTLYTYVHNLQSDIVGILDSTGNLVVEYKYDVWGRTLSTTGSLAGTLGKRNPFRYRGYVFDEEAGLYYLRSRYYYPDFQRFINADAVLDTRYQEGLNLFCYGLNSPLSFADVSGSYAYSTIHNAVCEQISCDNPEIVCTVYVVGISRTASGTGFIDLINPFTGEAWEVKKATLSYNNAEYQLSDYITGTAYLKKPIKDLKTGGFIPCGVAYYDDMIMPYYYVGKGVIMYETYRRQKDGSYAFSPALSSVGEKNLAQNRARKLVNYPDEALPRLAGGPGLYWEDSAEWRTALNAVGAIAIVGGSVLLGYLAAGVAGAYVAGSAAVQRTTMR